MDKDLEMDELLNSKLLSPTSSAIMSTLGTKLTYQDAKLKTLYSGWKKIQFNRKV